MCVILSVYAKILSFSVKKCSVHSDVMHERHLTPPHVRRHFLPQPGSQKFRSGMQEKVFHDFYGKLPILNNLRLTRWGVGRPHTFSVKKFSVHPDVMHERHLTPPHVRRHFLPQPGSQKFRSGMQEKVFHDFYGKLPILNNLRLT